MSSDYIRLFRYLTAALDERGEITELDIDFLASKGFGREDLELVLDFFCDIGLVKIDTAGRRAVIGDRGKLRKMIDLLNK